MTEQRAEYVVAETPTNREVRARAELKAAEHKLLNLREKFWRVDKRWVKEYGLETAMILTVIRDTTEIPGGYGVYCRKIPGILELAGMAHTKRHIRAFHKARKSGEFFEGRGGKTGRTYVFAANQPLL